MDICDSKIRHPDAAGLVICGVPAVGKSTLAAAVRRRCGVPVLSTDQIRKELAGLRPADRAQPSAYTAAVSRRVYTVLGWRAAASIRAHGAVLIDGTFRYRLDRAAFAAAFGHTPSLIYIECRVPLPTLMARAAIRDRTSGCVSDATAAIVAREHSRWQPLIEVPASRHVIVSADQSLAEAAGRLAAFVRRGTAPGGGGNGPGAESVIGHTWARG